MSEYTFYNNSGKIICNLICKPEDLQLNLSMGENYVEGTFSSLKYWVNNGQPTPKQDYTPTILGNFVGNLPVPCEVEIEGTSYHVDDGAVVLNANLIGPYTIKIKSLTHLDKEVTIP